MEIKQLEPQHHKLKLSEYVWFGFNLVCGVSFISAYYTLLISQTKNGLGLGYHLVWILILESVIAGTCAWAFARLSRAHKKIDGAGYVYTRSSFGRFLGWLISVFLYTTMPLIITTHIVAMVRLNFTTGLFVVHWGPYRNAFLDLIGMLIYGAAASIIFLGFRIYKRIFKACIYSKWILTGFLCAAALVLTIMSGSSNFIFTAKHTSLSLSSFSSAFTACFFFFTGFETFATFTKNIRNPERNIPLGLLILLGLTTVVMLGMSLLFIGALSKNGFQSNAAVQIFAVLGGKLGMPLLKLVGGIIMIFWYVAIKVTAAMENSLYSGSVLQPIAEEGYISHKLASTTHENIGTKAIRMNILMNYCFFVFWLIIPDIIYGKLYGEVGNTNQHDTFTYTDLTSVVSVFLLIIYIIVLLSAIKLSLEKKMKYKTWELYAWMIIELFLVWQVIQFFYHLILLYTPKTSQPGGAEVVKPTVQIVFFAVLICYIIGWYLLYYLPKYKNRLARNPKIQKALDAQFDLIDDWKFVAKHIDNELTEYIKRNKKVVKDPNSKTARLASELKTMMQKYEDDLLDENNE